MGFSLQVFMDSLMSIRNSHDLYDTSELLELYEETIYEAYKYAVRCEQIKKAGS